MYSLMLMTAMAGAPASTGFGGTLFGGCSGSCHGVSYLSCSGSGYGSYSNCYGGSYYSACTGSYYSSCTGCCGGTSCCGYATYTACCGGGLLSGLHSRLSGLFQGSCSGYSAYPVSSCCGYTACCGGSCCGYSSSYYYGSCHGYASGPYYSVYGGCYSTCCGGGVYGGCYGTLEMSYPTFGCGGGCGGVIVAPSYTPVMESGGVIIGRAVAPAQVAGGTPAGYYATPETGTSGYLASAPPSTASGELPAHLAVELPANAKLYVDGTLIRGEGDVRHFHTPDLTQGKAFYYELRAEYTVAGKVEVEEKKVVVRAGDRLSEAFPKLLALAKPSRAPELASVGAK